MIVGDSTAHGRLAFHPSHAVLNFPMHASNRFWMEAYSVWPVQDSTLQTGEEDKYKLKTSI